MAVPFALMGAGTAAQIIGQYSSNWMQAQSELKNSAFYDQQAKIARDSAQQQEDNAEFSWSNRLGEQIGAYAKGGVDLSGSAANTVGGSIKNALQDFWNIKENGDMQVKLLRSRATQSKDTADLLSSPGYNLTQGFGTFLGNYTKSEGLGLGFPSWLKPDTLLPSNTSGTEKYFPSVGPTSANPAGSKSSLGTYESQYFGTIGG